MTMPSDPTDHDQPAPRDGGFTAPGGSPAPSSGQPFGGQRDGAAQPPAGGQQYGGGQYGGGQQYGSGQPYAGQPPYGGQQYGGQPPYGSPTGGSGDRPGPNKLGLASLIVGGVSVILAFIPFVNFVSWIVALVGLVLGIVALVLKNRTRGLAIGGVIASALGLILSIVLAIVYTVGFATTVVGGIADNLPEQTSVPGITSDPGEERTVEVVYEVTGESSDATIVYLTATSGETGSDVETVSGQTLPWTEEFDATIGGEYSFSTFNLTATNGTDDAGEISCSITVDGEVVAEDTADGELATVSCTSSDFD
jgi:hypothetical protein